jgi:hypothetical protein
MSYNANTLYDAITDPVKVYLVTDEWGIFNKAFDSKEKALAYIDEESTPFESLALIIAEVH